MKKVKFDLRFLYLFIPFLLLEIFFRIVQIPTFDIFSLLKVFLYTLFISLLLSFILTRFKSNKVYVIVGGIFVVALCGYTFAELIFKNFMGDYYSFGTVSDGATRIAQFAGIFLSNARPKYYLCLSPILVYILLRIFVKFNGEGQWQVPLIFCILSFLALCGTLDLGSSNVSILHTYATFNNKDILIDKIGVQHFLFRDLTALGFKAPEKIVIEVEQQVEETPIVEDKKRVFNDSKWKSIASEETNSNMQTIDSYLMSKSIAQPNEMTGIFEGYNMIYVLVESGDYLMIDKDLTPTLYKMYNGSIQYDNHYTPLYSCGTGESEYVSYTSVFPYTNVCTPNYMLDSKFPNALPQLFKNEGYTTFGIHNWRDEWYDRNSILNAMGIDEYYDIDDIWQDTSIEHTDGWQSDSMLCEQTYKHIKEIKGNFFVMLISSTMHFPYDEASYWGDYYVEDIKKVHPDWDIDYCRYMSKSMDFDRGMQYLIEQLDKDGRLDNTVFALYCDHRPYWLDYDKVIDYTAWLNDRSDFKDFGDSGDERVGIYRSPFLVYNTGFGKKVISNYCSTIDHVPTLANMFDLNYDPRLYMGKDASSYSNVVIFTNGDWINEAGIYDASTDVFTPSKGKSMPEKSYIDEINKQVSNTINISYLILDEEYFSKRQAICVPTLQ